MISKQTLASIRAIRKSFQEARPFKHVCIDKFLESEIANRLLDEFPPFEDCNALNEFGKRGGKAVNTDLNSIGPSYRRLLKYISSQKFLTLMADMLGMPDLLFDPQMYGGGTHENLEGQELDPHVDFNFDQVHGLHRRVNLLIYLNKEWDTSWGGAIELHSDPWDWESDNVETFNCNFNRCVIFETNERSWHGFREIRLPEGKKNISRKCISIYLYSKTRPEDEIAPPHGTFYAQRPLPREIIAGRVLTDDDIRSIKKLLRKRDEWIRFYQRQELTSSAQREASGRYIASLVAAIRVPTQGYVSQVAGSAGFYADGWVAPCADIMFDVHRPVVKVRVEAWLPENVAGKQVSIAIDRRDVSIMEMQSGQLASVDIDVHNRVGGTCRLSFTSKSLLAEEQGSDTRALSFVLVSIAFEHADSNQKSRRPEPCFAE